MVDVYMSGPVTGLPPWQDADWRAEADAWIDARLAEAGLVRTGTATGRGRMWSVVARVPVEAEDCVWFKANPPASVFEPGLLDALARWAPDMAVPLVAVDVERGWTLSRNVGSVWADRLEREPDSLALLTSFTRRYAELQRSLAARVDDLLALGVPDLRPSAVPERFEALLNNAVVRAAVGRPVSEIVDPTVMNEGSAASPDEPWVSVEQFEELRALGPTLRAVCAELEQIGVPASIDHSDLHPRNILDTGGNSVPFDWGDATVGHPFSTLLILMRSAEQYLAPAALEKLRDAYLDSWRGDGRSEEELRRAAELAMWMAPLSRALAWRRVFPCFEEAIEPGAQAVRWLARLLRESPLSARPGQPLCDAQIAITMRTAKIATMPRAT